MQPHPPQLPTDAPTSPAPKNLKKGALLLALVVAIAAVVVALLVPKNQVEANKAGTTTQPEAPMRAQKAQSDAYKAPSQ